MAPSNLQGLNIVHPVPPPNPYLSDADLLSVPPFPDLNAQLDLWTNLNFQSDEPLISARSRDVNQKDSGDAKRGAQDDSSEDDPDRYNDPDEDLSRSGIAEAHSHENVVMGTVLPSPGITHAAHPPSTTPSAQAPAQFDINALLASFGVDPFMMPPAPMPQAPNPANTIAQLLSLHASTVRPAPVAPSQPIPSTTRVPAQSPLQAPSPAAAPTTKRARTSRGSVSSVPPESPVDAESPDDKPSGTPVTAAEDKRRRNTAASARFRLKKKEREAALERKAKELETRVSELEKECEALRRENGWLKGLVVGVTGAGAAHQQQQQLVPSSVEGAGVKRAREDDA
ncbi:hypothetical protein C8T65DRAFT_666241 [Cerioporus squamosus]|nr:hypothetical protein C8T65DRAFT_666241 [Cerioporus squamosus]